MSIERINGFQDRKLEVGRDKTTPTKESDITPKARLFKRLVNEAVIPTMALEGMSGGKGTQEMIDAQVGQLRAIKREAVIGGIGMDAFQLRVKMKVDEIKKQQELDDAEFQARQGEVPPVIDIINFGNHMPRKPIVE